MQTIAESDAIKRFAKLLDTIEQGEEVTVTRKGKPVARIDHGTSDGEAAKALALCLPIETAAMDQGLPLLETL